MKNEMQMFQIPGCKLPVTGLKANFHILRHNLKIQKCPLDAGMDLYPSEIDKVTKHGHGAVIWVHTMMHIHVPPGFKGIVDGRSSSVDRLVGGIILTGIIDAGYTGELLIRVFTHNSDHAINTVSGAIKECQINQVAIAQLMIDQCLIVVPEEVDNPPMVGGRGNGGFGSTDKIGNS